MNLSYPYSLSSLVIVDLFTGTLAYTCIWRDYSYK
ncbi:hypothetical protein OROGR_012372 [Orobanche gracilis]